MCRRSVLLLIVILSQPWESSCWQGSFGSLKHRLAPKNVPQHHLLPLSRLTRRRHTLTSNAKSNDMESTERIEMDLFKRTTQDEDHILSETQILDEQEMMMRLTDENHRLREALDRVETENARLQQNFDTRIVLEVFEGESRMKRASDLVNAGASMTLTTENMIGEEAFFNLESTETEECLLDDDEDSCPIEPQIPFKVALRDRAFWLVGLLSLQSCSGFILANNEALLGNHPVSKYFGSR